MFLFLFKSTIVFYSNLIRFFSLDNDDFFYLDFFSLIIRQIK